DAERRNAELEDRGVAVRRALRVDRGGTTGEDQRRGVSPGDLRGGRPVGDELGVHPGLADATCDQLRVLPAEVQHEHRPLLRMELGPEGYDLRIADSWERPS